jgi:hypothetical protein
MPGARRWVRAVTFSPAGEGGASAPDERVCQPPPSPRALSARDPLPTVERVSEKNCWYFSFFYYWQDGLSKCQVAEEAMGKRAG